MLEMHCLSLENANQSHTNISALPFWNTIFCGIVCASEIPQDLVLKMAETQPYAKPSPAHLKNLQLDKIK